MLRGVLLHVSVMRPINLLVGPREPAWRSGLMRWGSPGWTFGSRRQLAAARSVDDFYHLRVAQGAQVVRLAARGWVEGGLIAGWALIAGVRRARD